MRSRCCQIRTHFRSDPLRGSRYALRKRTLYRPMRDRISCGLSGPFRGEVRGECIRPHVYVPRVRTVCTVYGIPTTYRPYRVRPVAAAAAGTPRRSPRRQRRHRRSLPATPCSSCFLHILCGVVEREAFEGYLRSNAPAVGSAIEPGAHSPPRSRRTR